MVAWRDGIASICQAQKRGCNSPKLLFDGIARFTGFQKIESILPSRQKQSPFIHGQLLGIASTNELFL
jgi:hypothetical protein